MLTYMSRYEYRNMYVLNSINHFYIVKILCSFFSNTKKMWWFSGMFDMVLNALKETINSHYRNTENN